MIFHQQSIWFIVALFVGLAIAQDGLRQRLAGRMYLGQGIILISTAAYFWWAFL